VGQVQCPEGEFSAKGGNHSPGVFLSEDRGARWKPVNSGLRRAPDVPGLEKLLDLWIESLAVCGPYLFAGTQNGEIWRLPLSDLK